MHPKPGGKSAPSAGVGVHNTFDRHDQWARTIADAVSLLAMLADDVGRPAWTGKPAIIGVGQFAERHHHIGRVEIIVAADHPEAVKTEGSRDPAEALAAPRFDVRAGLRRRAIERAFLAYAASEERSRPWLRLDEVGYFLQD